MQMQKVIFFSRLNIYKNKTSIAAKQLHLFIYLLQGVGLVAALVQQAVSRVGGHQRASGVRMVN